MLHLKQTEQPGKTFQSINYGKRAFTGTSRMSKRRAGSTLVEFALIVPVLLAMVLGIIEFGWLIKNNLTIANATRDGARAAALGQPTTTIRTRIRNEAAPVAVTDANITITKYNVDGSSVATLGNTTSGGSSVNDATAGQLIRVNVRIAHRQLTGFFPFLRNRAIQSDVVMRRE